MYMQSNVNYDLKFMIDLIYCSYISEVLYKCSNSQMALTDSIFSFKLFKTVESITTFQKLSDTKVANNCCDCEQGLQ